VAHRFRGQRQAPHGAAQHAAQQQRREYAQDGYGDADAARPQEAAPRLVDLVEVQIEPDQERLVGQALDLAVEIQPGLVAAGDRVGLRRRRDEVDGFDLRTGLPDAGQDGIGEADKARQRCVQRQSGIVGDQERVGQHVVAVVEDERRAAGRQVGLQLEDELAEVVDFDAGEDDAQEVLVVVRGVVVAFQRRAHVDQGLAGLAVQHRLAPMGVADGPRIVERHLIARVAAPVGVDNALDPSALALCLEEALVLQRHEDRAGLRCRRQQRHQRVHEAADLVRVQHTAGDAAGQRLDLVEGRLQVVLDAPDQRRSRDLDDVVGQLFRVALRDQEGRGQHRADGEQQQCPEAEAQDQRDGRPPAARRLSGRRV